MEFWRNFEKLMLFKSGGGTSTLIGTDVCSRYEELGT